MTKFSNHKARRGFTLIELLIVIGLLGALTALVLPAMMADREDALGNVCDYNQAGTVRVLKQFQQITGKLPNGMHSGLQEDGTAMPGLPSAQKDNFNATGTIDTLTEEEANALKGIGITQVARGVGLEYVDVTDGTPVVCCTNLWQNDYGSSNPKENEYSFDGLDIGELTARGMSKCVVLWIAPTTAWEAAKGGNKDWGGGNVSVGLDLEGQCPIPAEGIDGEPDFSYYMAYVGIFEPSVTLSQGGVPREQSAGNYDFGTVADALDAMVGSGTYYTNSGLAPGDAIADAEDLPAPTTTSDPYGKRTSSYTVFEDDGEGNAVELKFTVIENATSTARLLGTSCPECGILNP